MNVPLLRHHPSQDLHEFLPAVYILWLNHGFLNFACTYGVHCMSVTSVAIVCYFLVECIDYTALLQDGELLDAFTIGLPSSLFGWFFAFSAIVLFIGAMCYIGGSLARLWTTRCTLVSWFGPSWDISVYSWPDLQIMLANHMGMEAQTLCHLLGKERSYIGAMVRAGLLTWQLGDFEIPYITHVMEWLLFLVVLPIIHNPFPSRGNATDEAIRPHATVIRKRALFVLLVATLTTPCVFIMTLVYYIIRYGQFVRLTPTFLLSRHWSQYALWYTWHPNEMRHEVTQRLAGVREEADLYAAATSFGVHTTVLSTVRFYSSLVCVSFLGIMFMRDDFTHVTLCGNSLLWWVTLAATVYTVCQSLTDDKSVATNRTVSLATITTAVGLNPEFFRSRFGVLYEYRVIGFVKELLTIAALPVVVYLAIYRRAHNFASFLISHSYHMEGVGNVLS